MLWLSALLLLPVVGGKSQQMDFLPLDSLVWADAADLDMEALQARIDGLGGGANALERLTLRRRAVEVLLAEGRYEAAAEQLYRLPQELFALGRFDLTDGVYRALLDLAEAHSLREWQYNAANALAESARVRGQFDTAIYYANYHFRIPGPPDRNKRVLAASVLGLSYMRLGQYDSAYKHINWGLEQNLDLQDSTAFLALYEALAYYYDSLTDYDAAAEAHLKYMEYLPAGRPPFLLKGYYNLSVALYRAQNYAEARTYVEKALALADEMSFGNQKTILYSHLGNIFQAEGDYDAALQAMDAALAGALEAGLTTRLARMLERMASLHMDEGFFERAEQPILEGLEYSRQTGIPADEALLLLDLGRYHLGMKQPGAALERIEQAGRILTGLDEVAMNQTYLQRKAEALAQLGRYRESLDYWEQHRVLSDSLRRSEQQATINKLNARYQSELKDREIEALDRDNQFKTLQLEQAGRFRWFLLTALILLAAIAGLAYRQARFRTLTNRRLELQKEEISRALSEKEVLLKEIHHRVKNNLQIVSSLLSLQTQNVHSAKAQEALKEGQNRVKAMALIHQNLYQDDQMVGVPAQEYIEELAVNLLDTYRTQGQVELKMDLAPLKLDVDRIIPVGLILNELLTNSLKYGFPNGRHGVISIRMDKPNGYLTLRVADNGVGLPRGFDRQSATSLGFRLVRAFANKLEGTLQVNSEPGNGAEVVIAFPV